MKKNNGLWIGILISLALTSRGYAQRVTLEDCLQTAEKEYRPLQLAAEEVGVREAKVGEAARALWPGLNLKGELTHGAALVELGTPGFREGSYGVQVTQTLFNGGKLWATYQQARLNQRIAGIRQRKARLEMGHQLKEAYWNLVRVQGNLELYAKALKDHERYLEMAQTLFKDGTIKKRTVLVAEAQKNNALYHWYGAEADQEKYRWNLAAAMGLDQPQAWQLSAEIPVWSQEPVLAVCLKAAEENNQEYLIQRLSQEAAWHEKTVQDSQDWPKLELTGFYGRSGGAYNSEDLKLTEDYNLSVKLTQNIAWNSLALSGFEQKTSPKLGQSSRTESRTASASIGLLDGYKSAAEKKEAGWHYGQAEYNRQKAFQTMQVAVRDAFFNLKKGQAQLTNARLDVELAKSELAIQLIHLRDEKASVSDVAEARAKLADSEAAYQEAKVYCLLAFSALDQAVGVDGFSQGPHGPENQSRRGE